MMEHLEENIFRAKIQNLVQNEVFVAEIYGSIELHEGYFYIPDKTNEVDYNELDAEGKYGILYESNSGTEAQQKAFFISENLHLNDLEGLKSGNYDYTVFKRYQAIEKVDRTSQHLFVTVFRFWMPYLIFASAVYIVICGVIISYIAKNITKPILELSKRIRLNVENIQKRKQRKEKGTANKSNYIELQVDLLRGYKQHNRETNELFINFNKYARILFVGHESSLSAFSYQAFFNLTAAAELLQEQNNQRGAGACYMILGIKLATQMEDAYDQAI